jgi:hypothetical protein
MTSISKQGFTSRRIEVSALALGDKMSWQRNILPWEPAGLPAPLGVGGVQNNSLRLSPVNRQVSIQSTLLRSLKLMCTLIATQKGHYLPGLDPWACSRFNILKDVRLLIRGTNSVFLEIISLLTAGGPPRMVIHTTSFLL